MQSVTKRYSPLHVLGIFFLSSALFIGACENISALDEDKIKPYVDFALASPLLRAYVIEKLTSSRYLNAVVETVVSADCGTATEQARDALRSTVYTQADGSYVLVVCARDKKKAAIDAALAEYQTKVTKSALWTLTNAIQ